MFKKIAQYIENRFPNRYWEAISLFITQLSVIKLWWFILLIAWNIVVLSALFNNAALLVNGQYTQGVVENIIPSQQICGRHYDRTCTSYDALIGYNRNNLHYTFQSEMIGKMSIGSTFSVILRQDDQEAYTLVGVLIISCFMVWQLCIFIPIYLIIRENIGKMMQRVETKPKHRTSFWIWIWAYGMLLSFSFIASAFFYFQGDYAMLYVIIFFVCIIMYQMRNTFTHK